MRTTPKIKINMIRAVFIVLLGLACMLPPLTVMAESNQFEQFLVSFDTNSGEFVNETNEGIRIVPAGGTLTNFPQNPTRYGYVFDGWQIADGARSGERLTENSLVVYENMALIAIWVRYGEATTTPAPGTPTPTPAATATPTPSPETKADAGRPNPTTNPIAISIMIFVAVMSLGLAAFGIIKLMAHQALATGKYRSDSARYIRESRLADLLKDEAQREAEAKNRRRRRRRRRMYY